MLRSLISRSRLRIICFFFFFNDTATTEIYTLSLHDALPIYDVGAEADGVPPFDPTDVTAVVELRVVAVIRHEVVLCAEESKGRDRKSTRLNSSHVRISYAVFCLKKKKSSRNR